MARDLGDVAAVGADVFPGPTILGRSIVIGEGGSAPAGFDGHPRVVVDDETLRQPGRVIDELHTAWVRREPRIIELRSDAAAIREPESRIVDVWSLDPSFEFARERLQFLIWANSYDCRRADPIWWWARKAERLGASAGTETDITLPDGTAAWCDGGPRERLTISAAVVHRNSIDAGHLRVDRMQSPPADDLADDQHEAVAHSGGPARIIAPAGSGKTRVLTARYRHLVVDRNFDPEAITALAYNARAAAEMRERTADVPGGAGGLRTLHSLGFAIHRAANPNVQVIEERDVRQRLERVTNLRPRTGTDVLAPYIESLGLVRGALISPAEVEDTRDDVDDFAQVFTDYRSGLERAGEIDFDEQIYGAIEILLRDPQLRTRVQRTTRHLLVDEFQDLTPAHLLLIRLVAAPAYDVFGVGDDDQTIYGYAGANPEFLINYDAWFPGAQMHALTRNYRCPAPIVEGARTLLSYNRQRVDKVIEPASAHAGDLTVSRISDDESAPTAVALIQGWIAEGVNPGDIAILSRVNATLLASQILLRQAGIEADTPLGRDLLGRTGMRTALAYLRIAVALADGSEIERADIQETVVRPARRINRVAKEAVSSRRRWSIDGLRRAADRMNERDQVRFAEYIGDLASLGTAVRRGATTAVALRQVRDRIGLGSALDTLDGARSEVDRSGHGDDLASLIQVASLHDDPRTFSSWLADQLDRRTEGHGVTLSTVHRVKGMEWPRVIVIGASKGLFPHRLATSIEEERRIFHVAITRAVGTCVVLASATEPSRFLDELTGQASHKADPIVKPILKQAAGPPANPEVVEALKAWRTEQARERAVPPYVILHDRHIEAIAARGPTSLDELAYCPGIGPKKLEQYGDAILEVLGS